MECRRGREGRKELGKEWKGRILEVRWSGEGEEKRGGRRIDTWDEDNR